MESVAAFVWNRWQLCRGIGGRIRLESVAALPWNTHPCRLAPFFLWPLPLRWEKKSPRAYGLASPEILGGGGAPQSLPGGCGPTVRGRPAPASAPDLSRAQEKAL